MILTGHLHVQQPASPILSAEGSHVRQINARVAHGKEIIFVRHLCKFRGYRTTGEEAEMF